MPSQMYTSFSPGDLGDVEGCSYVRTAHPELAGVSCDYIGLEVKKKKKNSINPVYALASPLTQVY